MFELIFEALKNIDGTRRYGENCTEYNFKPIF